MKINATEVYVDVHPVLYDRHFCAHAINAIIYLVAGVHLKPGTKLDHGRKRLIEYDANRFRRMIVLETGQPLPPLRFEYPYGGNVAIGWKREGDE